MGKGIIVLDEIPKRCADCPVEVYEQNSYGDRYSFECPFEYKGYTADVRETKRLGSCPTRPIPERKMCSKSICIVEDEYNQRKGWNACIDEIEGSAEK